MSSSSKGGGREFCFCRDEIKSLAFLAVVINCAAEAEIKSEGTVAIVFFVAVRNCAGIHPDRSGRAVERRY